MIWPPLCNFREKGLWWFRVFGYGLHYKNTDSHPLLFSERRGGSRRKLIRIGKHHIGTLKPRT